MLLASAKPQYRYTVIYVVVDLLLAKNVSASVHSIYNG